MAGAAASGLGRSARPAGTEGCTGVHLRRLPDQPVLTGEHLRLEPLTAMVLERWPQGRGRSRRVVARPGRRHSWSARASHLNR